MPTVAEVLSFFAEFKGVSGDQLSDSVPLGLSSLAAQRFRVALQRKFGITLPDGDPKSLTAKDVANQLAASPSDGTPRAVSPVSAHQHSAGSFINSSPSLGIGIDIEQVQEFRSSADPQADPFFQALFTPAEFGYCLIQPDPAPHFAARFCAKEALRKCGPEFIAFAFNEIQIRNRADGTPYYEIPHLSMELSHVSLSLSHTNDFAIAVAARR